jgi:hypothetical protein
MTKKKEEEGGRGRRKKVTDMRIFSLYSVEIQCAIMPI